jgi:hypothetical protein
MKPVEHSGTREGIPEGMRQKPTKILRYQKLI